jgi:hypothetical protein
MTPEIDAIQFEQSHQRNEIERLVLRMAALEQTVTALTQRTDTKEIT